MKKREILYILLGFVAGVISVSAILVLAFMIDTKAGEIVPLNSPRYFGRDIKIWIEKTPAKQREAFDISTALRMSKNGIPFFMIWLDKAGEVTNLALNGRDNLCFNMRSSSGSGKWEHGVYSGHRHGVYDGHRYNEDIREGEMYVDIDFDGQFDAKYTFDELGKLISKHIYLNGIWKEINSFENKKAILGQTTYVFDANSGWRKE
jgi:hypothetical protein